MLLTYLDLLDHGLLLFLTFAGAAATALIIGIAFHEFSHAFAAYLLGDTTARDQGRLSLNPAVHLDPAGTALLLIAGFGWGKPTPVNPFRLQHGPRTGRAIVAAAGPLSNIILAVVASIPIHLGLAEWRSPFFVPFSTSTWAFEDYLGLYLSAVIIFNVVLCVFNLLPISPLDGFSVALGILPRELANSVARLEPYGPMILLLLLVLPFVTQGSVSLLHEVMSPAINGLTRIIAGEGRAIG